MSYTRRPHSLFWTAVLLAALVIVLSCTDHDAPATDGVYTISFDEYRGTRHTLPEHMTVSGVHGDGAVIGPEFYPFSGVYDPNLGEPFSGFGAFTADGESYSFGIREHGETDLRDARLLLEYTNTTGRRIVGFRVIYDVETWIRGERDNRIRLKYHTDTRGFGTVRDIVSTVNPAGAASVDDAPQRVDGSRAENRARVEVSFLLNELEADGELGLTPYGPLEPGQTAYLRWQYSNARVTDGETRSALALNNIRVEPLFDGDTAPLAFSHPAGFYREPFLLELGSSLSGATIYYTVDGSQPDPDAVMTDAEWESLPRETRVRTRVYEEPVDVAELLELPADIATIPTSNEQEPWSWVAPPGDLERAVVVRAVAIEGSSRSSPRAATFLFTDRPQERFQLPVFSIAGNRGSFFDPDTGVYVPGTRGDEAFLQSNFLNRGTDWEREVHLEFFDDGARVLRQNLGLRIHGNFSRALPQKTLRLYSRSDYGTSRMTHRFFESLDITDFNRLLLRNGGNDWYRSMLTDPILQSLVAHLDFDTQAYRPAILFLNGEYWGIHNIRERYDQHYLETNYNLPRNQIVIVEDDGVLDVGDVSFVDTFTDFRQRLADGEFSSWADVNRYLDLGPYLDYLATQIYAGNYDWPQNNVRMWRYVGDEQEPAPSPRDGRWRVMMYDLDVSLGHGDSLTYDLAAWTFGDTDDHPFLPEGNRSARRDSFIINQSLMDIAEIREAFLERFEEHLQTTFHPDRVSEHIDRIVDAVESEVPRHIERWSRPESMDEWRSHIDAMHTFARERPDIVREQIRVLNK